jgi:hypothetical protein
VDRVAPGLGAFHRDVLDHRNGRRSRRPGDGRALGDGDPGTLGRRRERLLPGRLDDDRRFHDVVLGRRVVGLEGDGR